MAVNLHQSRPVDWIQQAQSYADKFARILRVAPSSTIETRKRQVWFVALAVASAALSVQPRSFVVAAYSYGGLVPFARFAGGRWVNTWPAPRESDVPVPPLSEIPTTWLGKSVPREWTFWPSSGIRRRMTVVGTRRGRGTGGGCTQPAVLTMGQTVGEETRGLAVDTDQVLGAVRLVSASSAEWRDYEPVIDSA
jgi:hypothetical protein